MAKITTPESLYGNSRDILREAERENEILADIAGETYESPGNIPNGKYVIEKRLLDAAQKKNELLESIAEGGGTGGSGAARGIGIDYATDVISLKNKDGETIDGSGATLPAYGLNYDTATGGLTLTKNGTAVQGQTVSLPDYGSPLTASSTAGMTDTSKVYVNTTDGKWYYYDGSAWVAGGTYNSQGIDTDTTLLVSGAAADAKATGDAVSDLKESLIESNLITEIQLPFTWERGNINNSGANANSTRYIRTPDYTDLTIGTYNINCDRNIYAYLICTLYVYDTNGTFQSKTNFTAPGTFTIEQNSKIRLCLYFGSGDTTTVLDPSQGNDLVTITTTGVQDVKPDKTLTITNRPADAKATGDAIADAMASVENNLFEKQIYTEWERGKISSTGTNAQSSSTVYIRNKYRYKIKNSLNHLVVPNGVTVELFGYSKISSGGGGFIEQIGTYTEDTDITLTPGIYVRMVAYYTDLTDTPLSVGDTVVLSYFERAQDAFDNYVNHKLNEYSSLSMFETFGVVGDSWASGSIHTPAGYVDTVYAMSWPQILARKTGATATNYSKGGLSTKTWLTDSKGLTALLADTPKQCYIINLGINDNTQIDAGTLSLGTIDDVNISDYTQNPDTFFGNYGRIIGNIKTHAPKAVIIILSVARPNERKMDAYIQQIADKYNLPYVNLEDDEYFTSGYFFGSIYGDHMSAYGYSGMANAIQRLIQNYIIKNRLMFAYYDGLTT